jgi:hypothetical protein
MIQEGDTMFCEKQLEEHGTFILKKDGSRHRIKLQEDRACICLFPAGSWYLSS